jgi:hypothetical protein
VLFATASAETSSSSTASTKFDGTYGFVSSTKVYGLRLREGRAGSLTIINGQVRLLAFEGTVGSQGELMMRHIPEPGGAPGTVKKPGVEGNVSGRIDTNGTARAPNRSYV